MKNHPLEAKLNWPKREDQICKYSKRTHLLCFRKAFFCNFTNFKNAESRKWNRVPLQYKSTCNIQYSMTYQWSRGRTEVRFPRDWFYFYTSLYTCMRRFDHHLWHHFYSNFLNHINCFCNDLAIFVYHVTVHVLSKLKWQRRHLKNNHGFDCSLKI